MNLEGVKMVGNHFVESDLKPYVRNLFGENCIMQNMNQIYGGAQKITYKVDCSNNFSFILYVWDNSRDYFHEEKTKNILPSGGADLFEINQQFLLNQGISTPKLYYIDRSKTKYPFDFAFVEYISGGDISSYYDKNPEIQKQVFSNLANVVRRMHSVKSHGFGSLKGIIHTNQTCQQIILEKTIDELKFSSKYIAEMNKNRLTEVLNSLYRRLKPRNYYSLIHGELGPNHVLVDKNLQTYLIDIECLSYFDIEYEHSFLEFRFENYNDYLKVEELDEDRLRFYKLTLHISYTTGAQKLLLRGYPDKNELYGMIEYNLKETLKFMDGPN
jgi:hypothetical protein